MKKLSLVCVFALFVTSAWSQIKYEKGYFIDNDGKKVDVLIKNLDWGYNPTEIEYKTDETSEPQKTDLNSIKEFGVYDVSKYISRTVNIDRSSEVLSELTVSPDPVFKQEKLMLKALVEGTANLYYFEDKSVKRFFYSTNDAPVEQLIFKTYRSQTVGETGKLGENNRFKQQLFNALQCSSIDRKKFEHLDYKKNSLIKIFSEYNSWCGSSITTFKGNEKRKSFNLNLRPRVNSNSLSLRNVVDNGSYDWGTKANFGLGLEAEFFLPFNNATWSIILEPTYNYFIGRTTSHQANDPGITLLADIDYQSFEFPLGVRHHFYLNENSRVFINASGVFDIVRNSSGELDIKRTTGTQVNSVDFGSSFTFNFAFGAGFRYKAFGVELRYQTPRDIFANFMAWQAQYKTTSVVISYSLFGNKP